jgi:hypothetical protein
MVELYGEDSVLVNLPTAMEGNAQTWWDSLQPDVKRRMKQSIDEWIDRLQTLFRAESSSALQQADALKHNFDDEDSLNVRDYLSKKQALYIEAGEETEDLIVLRMHDGLDPTLRAQVSLHKINYLDAFVNKVYANEHSARAQHEKFKSMVVAQV